MSLSIHCYSCIYDDYITDIPAQVDNYVHLVPLEMINKSPSQFGYPCSVYKAVNQKDGLTYCLRRIHGEYETYKI